MPKTSQRSRWSFPLLLTALLGMFSLCLGEAVLRLFFERQLGRPPANAERTSESTFWRKDASLGWSHVAGASGHFTNGAFNGEVHIDALGNRKNSAAGTFVPGFRNVFFLGDSTAVSLEVDDDQTVPAQIERSLRAGGHKINVVNLGVRGYGTDQCVRKALMLAPQVPPADIIYMYTENDIWDNNVLRQVGRKFGKGVYWRREGEPSFSPFNYPVPEYQDEDYGFVLFDEACRPTIHRGSWRRPARPLDTFRHLADDSLYLARAAGFIRHALQDPAIERIDPIQMMSGPEGKMWSDDFSLAYTDAGVVRSRCASYFDAQLRFLLGQLRTIPGLEHLYVVHFPDWSVVRSRHAGRPAPSVEAFRSMVQDHLLDGYVDLTAALEQEGIPPIDLQCPYDIHFCERGDRWIASHILDSIPRL